MLDIENKPVLFQLSLGRGKMNVFSPTLFFETTPDQD